MDGATLWGRVLEGVPTSNGELSLRAGTFAELLQALEERTSADARVADVLARGSRLAAAMKNAGGGLGSYSLEGSHVVITQLAERAKFWGWRAIGLLTRARARRCCFH